MKKQNQLINLALAAMFLALAFVMPFLTGQIQQIGNMLCPMHIPVILCGFICGGPWGLAVGFIAPLLRSLTLGMPPMYPVAFAMAFELAAYGLVSGILYRAFPKKKGYIYCSLIISMIIGRLVWGAVQFACMGLDSSEFGFAAFWAGAVTNAIPGIILQIILIPIVVILLEKAKIISKNPQ
ncbi:MAG: ECF transporter S component [Clostridia bacterium]|nr:ECF transporter S component [Clostridia bacterium]